jgi:hypothetical protein
LTGGRSELAGNERAEVWAHELDRRWHDEVKALDSALKRAQTLGAPALPEESVASSPAARLLSALTSPSGEAVLRQEAREAITEDSLEQSWFTEFGDTRHASPGNLLAMILMADLAAERTHIDRIENAEIQAAAARRRWRLALRMTLIAVVVVGAFFAVQAIVTTVQRQFEDMESASTIPSSDSDAHGVSLPATLRSVGVAHQDLHHGFTVVDRLRVMPGQFTIWLSSFDEEREVNARMWCVATEFDFGDEPRCLRSNDFEVLGNKGAMVESKATYPYREVTR